MFAFTGLAGRRIPFMRSGCGGLADGGDGLAVGVVEVAEGFTAEGGGAATVVVGEDVVAGGCWDEFHGWGLSPGYFWAQGWRESAGFSDSALNANARVLRGRRWASLATGPGLWVLWGLYLL